MPAPTPTPAATPLEDADIERLQQLLDAVPPPLEALDVMALDGYLCGVILQPRAVAASRWLPGVTDVDARPLPEGYDAGELHRLVRRRHTELERAITRRDWFDPWIFDVEEDGTPSEALLPWVAGFAAAQDLYPDLMAMDDPALIEPLALLYLHVPREDLEDADALLEVIDTIEPPAELAEAVQDLVRAVMLIADVSRPRPSPGRPDKPKGGGKRPPPGGGGRGRR